MIKIKRAYELAEKKDGYRILVDRLWPRGVSKEKAKIDFWLRDIAPSNELRETFGHDPKKWDSFQKKYKSELQKKEGLIEIIQQLSKEKKDITLVYAAKDEKHNNAIVLQEIIKK